MHGRHEMKRLLNPQEVMADLVNKGITVRVGSLSNIAEEAPSSYKDVTKVVNVCKFSFIDVSHHLTLLRSQHGNKQEGLQNGASLRGEGIVA